MTRNKQYITSLDDETVRDWLIYEQHGFGVVESPLEDGKTIQVFEGTELEAYIISEGMNIILHGSMSKRSSWETPTIRYKLPPQPSINSLIKQT